MRRVGTVLASVLSGIAVVIVALAIGYPQSQLKEEASSGNTTTVDPSPTNTTVIRVIDTRDVAGNDVGYKIDTADRMCGFNMCEIRISQAGPITTLVSLSDNRIVTFAAGQYIVSAQIISGNHNEIRGAGINDTVFKRDVFWFEGKGSDRRTDPWGDLNQIADADMFELTNRSSVKMHDFSIDGSTDEIGSVPIEGTVPVPTGKIFPYPKGKQAEIDLSDSDNISLHDLKISQVQRIAIDAKGTENATIESSDISSNGFNRDVLIYTGTPSRVATNLRVLNNYIHDGSHAGLFLQNVDGALVQGNLFDHNRKNTYFTGSGGQINILPDSHNIKIYNNTIINAGFTPASEMPKRTTSVAGNGVEVHGYDIELNGNTVRNNAGFGITVNDNTNLNTPPPHDITIKDNKYGHNGFGLALSQDVSVRIVSTAENVQVLDAVPLIANVSAST